MPDPRRLGVRPIAPRSFASLLAAFALVACSVARPAHAQLDGPALEEIGTTVKAAVASGAISEADATALYEMLVAQLGADAVAAKKDAARGPGKQHLDVDSGLDPKAVGGASIGRATAGDLTLHLEPLLLRRDLARIVDELSLGAADAAIATVLFDDLLAQDDAALDALRATRDRYEATRRHRALAITFDRVFVPDAATVDERTDERLRAWREELGNDEGDATDDWSDRIARASTDLHARLDALRARFEETLATTPGGAITAETLARRASETRLGRRDALDAFAESIAAATGADRARVDEVVESIDRDRRRARGRLAGESIDPTRAFDRAIESIDEPRALDDDARARLDRLRASLDDADALATIDALLLARDEARLDREARGLAFLAARDRIVDRANARSIGELADAAGEDLARALRPLADAMRRELAASVALRDATLAVLDETVARLESIDATTGVSIAARARAIALRDAFPRELRTRWCDRAFEALDLAIDETTDEDVVAAIAAIRASTEVELAAVRERAVRERVRLEPRLGRAAIDRLLGEPTDDELDPRAAWVGFEEPAFRALDERTEDRLRAILPAELAERLPVLKRTGDADALARWMREKSGGRKGGASKNGR